MYYADLICMSYVDDRIWKGNFSQRDRSCSRSSELNRRNEGPCGSPKLSCTNMKPVQHEKLPRAFGIFSTAFLLDYPERSWTDQSVNIF